MWQQIHEGPTNCHPNPYGCAKLHVATVNRWGVPSSGANPGSSIRSYPHIQTDIEVKLTKTFYKGTQIKNNRSDRANLSQFYYLLFTLDRE